MTSKLTDIQLANVLAGVPLFTECSIRQVRLIARAGSIVSKKEGAQLVTEGTRGVAFFVVLAGDVEISRDGTPVAMLRAGDFFGEMALLGNTTRNATATASTDVEMFALTEHGFKNLLLADPKIAYAVTRAVAARVATG